MATKSILLHTWIFNDTIRLTWYMVIIYIIYALANFAIIFISLTAVIINKSLIFTYSLWVLFTFNKGFNLLHSFLTRLIKMIIFLNCILILSMACPCIIFWVVLFVIFLRIWQPYAQNKFQICVDGVATITSKHQ